MPQNSVWEKHSLRTFVVLKFDSVYGERTGHGTTSLCSQTIDDQHLLKVTASADSSYYCSKIFAEIRQYLEYCFRVLKYCVSCRSAVSPSTFFCTPACWLTTSTTPLSAVSRCVDLKVMSVNKRSAHRTEALIHDTATVKVNCIICCETVFDNWKSLF